MVFVNSLSFIKYLDEVTRKFTVAFQQIDEIASGDEMRLMEDGEGLLKEKSVKQVKRLALLFDDEDATIFSRRLELARFNRLACLASKRLDSFVGMVPSSLYQISLNIILYRFASMPPSFLEKIVQNVMSTSEMVIFFFSTIFYLVNYESV